MLLMERCGGNCETGTRRTEWWIAGELPWLAQGM